MRAMAEALAYVRTGRRPGHGLRPLRAHRQPLQQRQARALPLPRGTGRGPAPRTPCRASAGTAWTTASPRRSWRTIEQRNLAEYNAASDAALQAPDPDPASIHEFVLPEPWVSGAVSPGPARRLRHPGEHAHRHQPDPQGGVPAQPRHLHLGPGRGATGTRAGSSTSPRACSRSSGASGCSTAPSPRTSSPAPPTASPASTTRSGWWWRGPSSPTTSGPPPSSSSSFPTNTGAPSGQFSPNVTIRLASGGYIGGGLYHSQNIEGFLTSIPGHPGGGARLRRRRRGPPAHLPPLPGREPVPGAQVPVQLRPGQGLRSRRNSPCRSARRGSAGQGSA